MSQSPFHGLIDLLWGPGILLVAPVALLAGLALVRARRRRQPLSTSLSSADGPVLIAALGLWGTFTQKPLDPWGNVGLECYAVAAAFVVLAGGLWVLGPVLGEPRGARLIGSLCFWAIASVIGYGLGNLASDEAQHGSLRNLAEPPFLYVLGAFSFSALVAVVLGAARPSPSQGVKPASPGRSG